jgi:FkbM family methyltransferase
MNIPAIALKISEMVRRFPFIHRAMRRFCCIFRPGMRFYIEQNFRKFNEVFVLKIGANDGVESDPLAEFLLNDKRYRGVFVEPIPQYAKMLSANYDGTGRFKIEQAAIAAQDGSMLMYYVDENVTDSKGQKVPEWLRGVAGLDRTHVEKHLFSPEMHQAIRQTTVECLSMASLLARNKMHAVDLLQIDTEGYDFMVLKQIDFSVLRPKIVIFEPKHLSQKDDSEAKMFMEKAGYEVKIFETDFLCLDR